MTGADWLGAFVRYAPQPGGLGPLGGMPVAVKDNIDVAGMPSAGGMDPYRGRVAPRDAHCVERLRKAAAPSRWHGRQADARQPCHPAQGGTAAG